MHVLAVIAAAKFERADAKRMREDKPHGLLLAAEAPSGPTS